MGQQLTVYILRSMRQPERWYTGVTSDAQARLAAHNRDESTHTTNARPCRLVVTIEFADAQPAEAFEAYLKSGSGRAFAQRHFRS